MKPPTLNALLGASFGLALCQFFPSLLALLDFAGMAGAPPAGAIIRAVVACAVAASIMRYSYADKPQRLPFIATAVYEAALAVYLLVAYGQALVHLVQRQGVGVACTVETAFYAIAGVSVPAASAAALAAVAGKLTGRNKDKAPAPDEADYWLGAVAGISFAVMLRALAVFVEFASRFPPKPTWPVLYGAKLTLNIVQLTMSPVALYGGLKADRKCIIFGMASAMLQMLLFAVLVAVANFIHCAPPAVLLPWSAVCGAQSMATVAVFATAYGRLSPTPPPYNRLRPPLDGHAYVAATVYKA